MAKDKKPTRREAAEARKEMEAEKAEKEAKLQETIEKVEAGTDIVALAAGAQQVITFEQMLHDHEVARLFALPKRKVGRPTKYEPNWMLERIIEVGRLGGSKDKMASLIGVHIDTMYEWAKEHPEFSEALKIATQLSKVWWENAGQGAMLGMVEGYRDTTWIFNMKNRFPETYRDVKVTELNNTGGPLIDARSITINARELDENTRAQLRAAIQAVKMLQHQGTENDE